MAVAVVGLVATFGMNFNVLIPPLAQDVLDSDAAGYGFLMTASGLGALAAAVALVLGGRPRPIRIALGGIVLGIASIAVALSSSFGLTLVLMFLVGAGGIGMAATANATIQLSVPDGLRGRVMSVYTTVFAGSVPVGGLAMGALASAAGIAVAIAIGGVLSLATGVVALAWWRRIGAGWHPTPMPARELAAVEGSAAAAVPPIGPIPGTAAVASLDQAPPSGAASAAPSTSAAFKPPKPNEVLSTRR